MELSRCLLKKPESFEQLHFSLGGPSLVISVDEVHKNTDHNLEVVHDHGSTDLRTTLRRKKLSMSPAAQGKRKSRANWEVRDREKRVSTLQTRESDKKQTTKTNWALGEQRPKKTSQRHEEKDKHDTQTFFWGT